MGDGPLLAPDPRVAGTRLDSADQVSVFHPQAKVGRQELIAFNCHLLAKALVRQGQPAEARPYPNARWKPSPGSARPGSKTPARFWRNAKLDRSMEIRLRGDILVFALLLALAG